jgi:hypothetical protein
MSITAPKNKIEEIGNKRFCITFEAGNIPFFNEKNEHIESTGWTVHSDTDCPNPGVNARFDFVPYGDSRFYNPTDENPMKAALFLNCHALPESVRQILNGEYKKLAHYHKDIDAMFKTLIFQRVKCIRYYSII